MPCRADFVDSRAGYLLICLSCQLGCSSGQSINDWGGIGREQAMSKSGFQIRLPLAQSYLEGNDELILAIIWAHDDKVLIAVQTKA